MSAQLEHPRLPTPAWSPDARVGREAVRLEDTASARPEPDRGIGLLLSFVGALSVMVADVVIVGAVDRSWILIPGFAVLLVMSVIVFRAIMRLLADNGEEAAPDAH